MRLFLIAALPLALLIYGHGLEAPYYLDDVVVLDSVSFYSPNLGSRTVADATFYLNMLAIDVVAPLFHWKPSFYYRLGNLLIHVLVATVLVGLVRELTGRLSTGYAVGFLFLAHPLTSEPVMYVTQRYQSLATLWIFVAGWSYVLFRKSGDWISGDRRWLLVTVVASVAAVFTKRFAYVLPLWILVLEFTYFSKLKWNWRYLYLVPVGEIVLWRTLLYVSPDNTTVVDAAPWGQYLLAQGPVLLKYLQLSVFPAKQFLFYDFPLATSISWSVILQWAVVLAVLATGFLALRRYPDIGFGIVTFFVLLLPLILIPRPNLVFEYRAYGSFAGIALVAGTLLTWRPRPVVAVMTVALIIAFGVRTYERSAEWNHEIPFFESHVAEFPDDPHALSFLALHYSASGQVNRSIEVLTHAQDNLDRFNDYYMRPGSLAIGLNLHAAQVAIGNLDAAGEVLEQLRVIGSDEPAFVRSEASWLLAADQPERAVEAFTRLVELDPDQEIGWLGLRIAYSRLGDETRADEAARRLSEVQDLKEVRIRERWFIPVRFRTHAIFGMLLMFFAITVICGRFVWSTARQRWSHG